MDKYRIETHLEYATRQLQELQEQQKETRYASSQYWELDNEISFYQRQIDSLNKEILTNR